MPDKRNRLRTFWLNADVGILVIGVCLVLSFLLSPENLPGLPLCPSQKWLGIACPGCGLTRAFISIAHFQWRQAWEYNPFAFPLYAWFLYLIVRFTLGKLREKKGANRAAENEYKKSS